MSKYKELLKEYAKKLQEEVKKIDPVAVAQYSIGGLALWGFWLLLTAAPGPQPEDATVMIVKNDRKGGGTGVVISSSPSESRVLTNAHVCGLLNRGGLVINPKQEQHTVTSYKVSKVHDLCLLTVSADLHANTKVADKTPQLTTPAKVSGHPGLLPMVVTRGHFSDTQIIKVLVGSKKCEGRDFDDENLGLFCKILGAMPIIKTFEAQVVTATIMPGSSGSAVYNEKGELSNLVFAGAGQIGYAFTVPYGFVSNFLKNETPYLETNLPVYEGSLEDLLGDRSRKDSLRALGEICKGDATPDNLKETCSIVIRDLQWRQYL